jgi:hypothetical protein
MLHIELFLCYLTDINVKSYELCHLSHNVYIVVCCVAEVILYIQPYVLLQCIRVVLPVIFYIVVLLKSHCVQIHTALPMSCCAYIPLQEYNPYTVTQNS